MSEVVSSEPGHEHTEHCIFCDIVEKKSPASVIEETDTTIVFMSLEGYPLIVPKKHIQNYLDPDLDEQTARDMGSALMRISQAVSKAYATRDISLISTNGELSGQDVMHLHVHVMPRFKEDNKVSFSRQPKLTRPELDSQAGVIRVNLNPANI